MRRIAEGLLLAIVFLLPWQTTWIYGQAFIAGEPFSFGVMNLYAIEGLIVVLLGCAAALSWRQSRRHDLRWMGLFLVYALLSATWAINTELGIAHWIHLAMAALLFLVVAFTRIDVRRLVWAFVLGLMVPVGLGIWQVAVGSSPAVAVLGLATRDAQTLGDAVLVVGGERLLRAYGSFPHPNIFGGYLAMGLVGAGWLWRSAKRQERRWVLLVGVLLFLGLTLSFSRSAWLGLFVLCIVLLAKRRLHAPKSLRGWLAAGKGARLGLALMILIAAALSPLIASRFSSRESLEAQSVSERVEQYGEFVDVFADHVFVGTGLRNYTLALEQIDPGRAWWEYQPMHNTWLLVLAELGVLGFLVLLLSLRPLMNLQALFLIPLGVISLFDHYLWSLWPGLALLALSAACLLRNTTYE